MSVSTGLYDVALVEVLALDRHLFVTLVDAYLNSSCVTVLPIVKMEKTRGTAVS